MPTKKLPSFWSISIFSNNIFNILHLQVARNYTGDNFPGHHVLLRYKSRCNWDESWPSQQILFEHSISRKGSSFLESRTTFQMKWVAIKYCILMTNNCVVGFAYYWQFHLSCDYFFPTIFKCNRIRLIEQQTYRLFTQ